MDINSMDINQLKATIDRLNKQSTQVNTVRNQNIGKRKTLEAQCAELFKQYSEKYGVELTLRHCRVKSRESLLKRRRKYNS